MSADAPWYRLLDHAGDMAILVRAATREGLYDAATRALFEVILDVRTVEPRERVAVRIPEAMDEEDRMVRYLSDLVYLNDTEGWLFRGAENVRFHRGVEADAVGEHFDAARHRIRRQVKAVTYHDLLFSRDREGWSARVVLDL